MQTHLKYTHTPPLQRSCCMRLARARPLNWFLRRSGCGGGGNAVWYMCMRMHCSRSHSDRTAHVRTSECALIRIHICIYSGSNIYALHSRRRREGFDGPDGEENAKKGSGPRAAIDRSPLRSRIEQKPQPNANRPARVNIYDYRFVRCACQHRRAGNFD